VNDLPGEHKYVAGHSLGNTVISSAIIDYNMTTNVDAYIAISAAVPSEAYNGSWNNMGMVNPDVTGLSSANGWTNYDPHLWSAEWYQLFSGDGRSGLTWLNRFGGIQNVQSFYSSGDEVLKKQTNANVVPWPGRTYSWVYQEMSKGGIVGSILTSCSQAGWVSNVGWFTNISTGHGFGISRQLTPDEANAISSTDLITKPFFSPFDDSILMDLANGSDEARKVDVRGEVLGGGIPALSDATGATSVFYGDTDMTTLETPNACPAPYTPYPNNKLWPWLHTSFHDVAYPFTHKLFDNIAGQLH
jgi:hypothetical protein